MTKPSPNRHHSQTRFASLWGAILRSSRAEVTVGIALLALSLALLGGGELVGINPDARATALAYLSAEARSDLSVISSMSYMDRTGAPAADHYQLDAPALRAALKVAAIKAVSIEADAPTITGSTAQVNVSYTGAGAGRRASLTLVREQQPLRLHPVWRVRLVPEIVKISSPAPVGDATVDGLTLSGTAGRTVSVAVFPGPHVISSAGGALFTAQPSTIELTIGSQPDIPVRLSLTAAGSAAAAKSVKAAFDACDQASAPGADCPQAWNQDREAAWSGWRLVGDPAADATYTIGVDGSVSVKGHYQLVGSATDFHQLVARGGSFSARLSPSGQAFNVSSFQPDWNASISRPPAATDALLLGAAKTFLAACAQIMSAHSAGCPQSQGDSQGSSFRWHLLGDPTAGATVFFSASTGMFRVDGTAQMTLDYDQSDYLGGTQHRSYTLNYPYDLPIFWDGSQAVIAAGTTS